MFYEIHCASERENKIEEKLKLEKFCTNLHFGKLRNNQLSGFIWKISLRLNRSLLNLSPPQTPNRIFKRSFLVFVIATPPGHVRAPIDRWKVHGVRRERNNLTLELNLFFTLHSPCFTAGWVLLLKRSLLRDPHGPGAGGGRGTLHDLSALIPA